MVKQSGGDIQNILSALQQKDADLYTYLNNELLDYLPNELRDFLLNSSLLPYLETELCNAAFQCSDSATKINQLHSLGILSGIKGEATTWRLHHLMEEFLKQKVILMRSPDSVASVRRRVTTFLEQIGDVDRAFEQVLACADWTIAIGLIHAHGDKYFLESGRLDMLHSWLVRLPEEQVNLKKTQHICKEACNLLVYPDERVKNSITMLIRTIVRETGVRVVHVNCLGGFRVFVAGTEISPEQWKTKKAENLFKLLIINRHQHHKEKIINELWPESDPKSGDSSLRMALTHVRKALGLKANNDASIILRRGMIFLNPEIEIYTDYEFFVSTLSILNDTDIGNPVILDNLEKAARLYQGDFLPENLYDDWSNNLRTQLRYLYLQVLFKQVECYSHQCKASQAIQACRRYLAIEPADEMVSRMGMELLWQTEQKQLAVSLYHKLLNTLTTEYDILPSVETTQLYDQIRCG